MAAGEKISRVPGNEHAVRRNPRFALQFQYCRPVLDVRHRRQVSGGMKVRREAIGRRPRTPALRRVGHEFPAKSEIPRQLLRRARFPVARNAVAVTDDVAQSHVAKRYADQARIVASAQGHDDRPPADAVGQSTKHLGMHVFEAVDQIGNARRYEIAMTKPMVAMPLKRNRSRRVDRDDLAGFELEHAGAQGFPARDVSGQAKLRGGNGVDRAGPRRHHAIGAIAQTNIEIVEPHRRVGCCGCDPRRRGPGRCAR